MADELSGTAVAAETSAPVTPPSAPAEPTIADHEAQYGGPNSTGTGVAPGDEDSPLDDIVDEDSHQPRSRGSRAKSKMAAARINKLTAEKIALTQRIEALEAKQQPPASPAQPVFALPAAPRPLPTDPEPTIEQFADQDDPYGAWQRALAKWDRQQESLQAVAGQQQQQFQQTAQQAEAYWTGVRQTHQARLQAAVQANPAAAQALQSVVVQPPPVLDLSIMLDTDSAAVALFLATHPTVLDEFVLMTAAQPVTEQTVAITRRLLRQRMSAGTTGSVAPSSLPTPPRPPNPVRTGATRSTSEAPGEGASIADHAKYWPPS